MTSLITLTYGAPVLSLARGEELLTQGRAGRNLFVLQSGKLVVERDGVEIATIEEPEALIGEMSLLTGKPYSATVKAERDSRVLVIEDAMRILERQPGVALRLAQLVSQRLDATSALLVELSQEHSDKPVERGLVGRILSVLSKPLKAGD